MAYHRPIPESKSRPGFRSTGFNSLVEAERLMQIAFVMPSAVLIGWAGGWWLASVTHLKWLEIVGVLLGCAAGMMYVVKMAIAAEKKIRNTGEENQPGNGGTDLEGKARGRAGKGTGADQP
jgi:ATP synthase protein I